MTAPAVPLAVVCDLLFDRLVVVDVAAFAILGGLHLLAWRSVSGDTPDTTSATTGGIQAVGILLPLSLVALQVGETRSGLPLPESVHLDVLATDAWLVLSLALGLLSLSLIPYGRYPRVRGVLFGWQLFAFLIGLARFSVAIYTFTTAK